MKRDELHRSFLMTLERKIPEKAKLIKTLSDTLFMEKGAIYRRLRGEVPFSFYEAVRIAETLNISINNLIYPDTFDIGRFELIIAEYTKMNQKVWDDYMSLIITAKDDPKSEFTESSNILPVSIFTGFDSLTRFFIFKYKYLFSGMEGRISFDNLDIPENKLQILKSYYYETKHFANTVHVWDYLIFTYLVTDIKFFYNVNLISRDEIKLIQKDLLALLDYIEEIAINGCFEETGKPVSFYISDINFDANYCCNQFNGVYISHVKSFILNTVQSLDRSSYLKMYEWIHSLKKSSTLISKSGAVFRMDYFEKQRKIISEL